MLGQEFHTAGTISSMKLENRPIGLSQTNGGFIRATKVPNLSLIGA
jgi:hypothetical protein